MWKPYLNVLAAEAGQALHVLDRFHITQHMNQAVDQVRRAEGTRLKANSKDEAKQLKNMHWPLLRKGSNGIQVFGTAQGVTADRWVWFLEDSSGRLWARGLRHNRVPRDSVPKREQLENRYSGLGRSNFSNQ